MSADGGSVDDVATIDASRDANGAAPAHALSPDTATIALFVDRVFGYCDGLIPVRGLPEKGTDGRPHTSWIAADDQAAARIATTAAWAAREGAALYVVPGTVAAQGQAKAEDVRQIQTIVVDLDTGDIDAKLTHLRRHLPPPVMVVESGGRTQAGAPKLHVWWRLNEPAEGADIELVCALRGAIADKVGGDPHFRSAHQPIRVAGSIYFKGGAPRVVAIRECSSSEIDLREFAAAVDVMPALPGLSTPPMADPSPQAKPALDEVLTRRTRAGGVDPITRFEAASMVIGHHVRLVHEGREAADEARRAVQEFNQACLDPPWPTERVDAEFDRLWRRHVAHNGPGLTLNAKPLTAIEVFSLGALLDDRSPMPTDIIAPRVLTPSGMLVLGGAPKVGKSDFLISLLVHMAAGIPFLGFTPPRPLRVFYLQAEIDYHYLRERLQGLPLPKPVLATARDNLVATPKLRLILDERGLALVAAAILGAFDGAPPDIICLDPIRNLFDGGADGGENDNSAMMFFLTERVEALREAVAPDCGVILAHHTKKINRKLVAEDPFQSLSGASALRGFYTTGLLMHQPDEEVTARKLEIELRNGPALPAKLIDKVKGRWVELNPMNERLVRKSAGEKYDAERDRKRDVILTLLAEQAAQGNMFTLTQFAAKFENRGSLGGQTGIRERMHVLATKGHLKFVRGKAATALGLKPDRSKFGYLCVRNMQLRTQDEIADPDTGEITPVFVNVLPSDFMCPQTGAILPVENPEVWVDQEENEA